MDKNFFKKLDVLLKIVNKTFTNINLGGCGSFALILGAALKEMGIESKAVCLQSRIEPKDIDKIKELYASTGDDLNELNQKGGFISHVVLEISGVYVDSTGVIGDLNDLWAYYTGYHNVGVIDLDKLRKWVSTGSWNDMFDVKQLPRIEYIVKKYINKEIDILDRVKIQIECLVLDK